MIRKIILALAFSGALIQQAIAEDKNDALIGIWKVKSGIAYLPDGSTRQSQLQESLIIFTESHYSMNWAGGGEPHPFSETPFRPTDEEKISRYSTLLINAGKYEVKGDRLIVHPEFALVPEYAGGYGEFTIGKEGGELTLDWTKIISADGNSDPFSLQGVHWKYFLVPVQD